MPKPTNEKKSDKKPSKKQQLAKQEKPPKDIKVNHAPPVSSKDIIAKAKANAVKPLKSKPALKPAVKKPVLASSSSEDSSGSESEPAAKPSIASAQKAVPNDESSESEDDTSEDEKPKVQQINPVLRPSADSSAEESSSSSESDSDAEASPKIPSVALTEAQPVKGSLSDADSSSDEESSSSESEEDIKMEDRSPVVSTGKRKAEDCPVLPAKKTKTTNGSTAGAKPEDGSTKTIFVGNLSWAVDNDRLSQEFADCGEVISARVQLDRNTGKSRGFGYVTFATTEAVDAAIALNGTKEIDGRTPNLDRSTDNGANKEKRAQAFGDARSAPTKVLFVGNLSWNTVEDTIWNAFSEYGEVTSVRIPTDMESGKPKGYGYIEFSAVDSAQKAIGAMNGKELDGRQIRLDFTQPRDASGPGRGRGAGRGRGGFDGGRGGYNGGRGGFDGGRGRGGVRGRGNDRGRGRGGARGGMRTGAIAASEGRKTTF